MVILEFAGIPFDVILPPTEWLSAGATLIIKLKDGTKENINGLCQVRLFTVDRYDKDKRNLVDGEPMITLENIGAAVALTPVPGSPAEYVIT